PMLLSPPDIDGRALYDNEVAAPGRVCSTGDQPRVEQLGQPDEAPHPAGAVLPQFCRCRPIFAVDAHGPIEEFDALCVERAGHRLGGVTCLGRARSWREGLDDAEAELVYVGLMVLQLLELLLDLGGDEPGAVQLDAVAVAQV